MFPFRRRASRITPDEAHRRTSGADASAVLLDVRDKPEWQAGHAPSAVRAPLSRLDQGAALPRAAQDRALVVICRSGTRSQRAAKLLAERGTDVVDVEGGMNAWVAAGHPVVDARGNSGSIA
ncbi:rhodanese-like domain-containing protein [Streptomyces sp. NPDC002838]|uniref:rhodanese-like domain-containing protein n=1 Tax=Streptomyces sp. NPDC002838 TaxID=3154436 RepID=UPI003321C5F1